MYNDVKHVAIIEQLTTHILNFGIFYKLLHLNSLNQSSHQSVIKSSKLVIKNLNQNIVNLPIVKEARAIFCPVMWIATQENFHLGHLAFPLWISIRGPRIPLHSYNHQTSYSMNFVIETRYTCLTLALSFARIALKVDGHM
jgi:hypothetical protein